MSDGSNPKPAKPGGGYAVGYGKPPKVDQFKPGQSGNPNGRPKGQPTTQQLLLQEAAKLVKVKVGDEIIQIPKQQAVVRKLYHDGDGGQHRCCAPDPGSDRQRGAGRSQWPTANRRSPTRN